MKIELAKTEVVHFVGIGGIGMSGLSLIMKGKGFKVQGIRGAPKKKKNSEWLAHVYISLKKKISMVSTALHITKPPS